MGGFSNVFISYRGKVLANVLILIGQPYILLPTFIVFGFYFKKKPEIPINLLGICLFTVIYNVFLKEIFGVPLEPPLKGYALPSGHMHFAYVFYLYIAIFIRKKITAVPAFALLTIGLGYALHALGYHSLKDIVAAIGFGTLTILLFSRTRLICFAIVSAVLAWVVEADVKILLIPIFAIVLVDLFIEYQKKGLNFSLAFLSKNRYQTF